MQTEIISRNYDAVQLQEVKAFIREDRDIEDPLIESLIRTAEKVITDYTGHYISIADFKMSSKDFNDFTIPYKPLKKGSVAIKYVDEDDVEQTLPETKYDNSFGSITFLGDLPNCTKDQKYPVKAEFQCGNVTEEIDEDLKTAIKLLVLIYYRRKLPEEERKNVNPLRIQVLRQLIIDKKISHFR